MALGGRFLHSEWLRPSLLNPGALAFHVLCLAQTTSVRLQPPARNQDAACRIGPVFETLRAQCPNETPPRSSFRTMMWNVEPRPALFVNAPFLGVENINLPFSETERRSIHPEEACSGPWQRADGRKTENMTSIDSSRQLNCSAVPGPGRSSSYLI